MIHALLAVLIALGIGPAPATDDFAPVESHHGARTADTSVTYTAVGDSITAWIDRNGDTTPPTWANYADSGRVTFLPTGWAAGGAKIAEIAAHVAPVGTDVLVIHAGTNDLGDRWGTPMVDRLAGISAMVNQSQAPRVLLSAVPPLDMAPEWATSWNATLQTYAAQQGWNYVDPWSTLRAADGRWVPGYTIDGIHPTDAGQRVAGSAMHAALYDLRDITQ